MKDYKNIFLGDQIRNGQEEEVKGGGKDQLRVFL